MRRLLPLLILLAAAVALPFAVRACRPQGGVETAAGGGTEAVVLVITPHNEAIRSEFGRGFAAWHAARTGRPARVEWIVIGGTSEIGRYLASETASAARAWWLRQGGAWRAGAAEALLGREPPEDPDLLELWHAFRATDDPEAFTAGVDLFFGGGDFDHQRAAEQGLLTDPWPGAEPADLALVPATLGGLTWRTQLWYGNALSTFGIVFNRDRLHDLGLPAPDAWQDLADPRLRGQVGLADPTKSSSITKAFEGLVQQQIAEAVRAAGFAEESVNDCERDPASAPAEYHAAIARGWEEGMWLLLRMGANARYFTPSSQRVPFEVAMGETAAGVAIDFYGRFQAQFSPAGAPQRVGFVSPAGGTSVTCDPLSLLRGAPHRAAALLFLEFVFSEEGQRLWCYRLGEPGGPAQYALRRYPIRRDFYPSREPALAVAFARHLPHLSDDFADPAVGAYALAERFTFRPRWTARHFAAHRDLVRAACLDAGPELRAAWAAVCARGGPQAPANAAAVARMRDLPVDWNSAPEVTGRTDRAAYLREWTAFFRANCRAARALAEAGEPTP